MHNEIVFETFVCQHIWLTKDNPRTSIVKYAFSLFFMQIIATKQIVASYNSYFTFRIESDEQDIHMRKANITKESVSVILLWNTLFLQYEIKQINIKLNRLNQKTELRTFYEKAKFSVFSINCFMFEDAKSFAYIINRKNCFSLVNFRY